MGTVGERLRQYRFRRGMSKRALAAALGVSVPTILRWESGETVPNDYNLYRIEQMLAQAEESRERGRPAVETLPLFSRLP